MKLKFSDYNLYYERNEYKYIFNTLNKVLKKLPINEYEKLRNDLGDCEDKNIINLQKNGIVLQEKTSEFLLLKYLYKKRFFSFNKFSISAYSEIFSFDYNRIINFLGRYISYSNPRKLKLNIIIDNDNIEKNLIKKIRSDISDLKTLDFEITCFFNESKFEYGELFNWCVENQIVLNLIVDNFCGDVLSEYSSEEFIPNYYINIENISPNVELTSRDKKNIYLFSPKNKIISYLSNLSILKGDIKYLRNNFSNLHFLSDKNIFIKNIYSIHVDKFGNILKPNLIFESNPSSFIGNIKEDFYFLMSKTISHKLFEFNFKNDCLNCILLPYCLNRNDEENSIWNPDENCKKFISNNLEYLIMEEI